MDSIAVRNVKQIPRQQKRSLEDLVGRELLDNQQVFILAFTPGVAPTGQARAEAMVGIEKTWAKVDRHMQEQGVTEEEFDAAVDEAVQHVRHGQE